MSKDGSSYLLKSDISANGDVQRDTKSGIWHGDITKGSFPANDEDINMLLNEETWLHRTKLQEENNHEYFSHEDSLSLENLGDKSLNEKMKDIKTCQENEKHDNNYHAASKRTASDDHTVNESNSICKKSQQDSILPSLGDTSICGDLSNKESIRKDNARRLSPTKSTQDRTGPMPSPLVAMKQGVKQQLTETKPSHTDGQQEEKQDDKPRANKSKGGKQQTRSDHVDIQQQTQPFRADSKEVEKVQTKNDYKNCYQEEKQQTNTSHVDIQKGENEHKPSPPSLSPNNKIDNTLKMESTTPSKPQKPCRPEHSSPSTNRSRANEQCIHAKLKALSSSLYRLGTNDSTSSSQSDSESEKESGTTHSDQPPVKEGTERKVTSMVPEPPNTSTSESSLECDSTQKEYDEQVDDLKPNDDKASMRSAEKDPCKRGVVQSMEGERTDPVGTTTCQSRLPKDQVYPGRLKYPEHTSKPPVVPFPNFPRQPQTSSTPSSPQAS